MIAASTAAALVPPWRLKAMTAKATPSIVQTPAARPSTPSEKFTMFISATSQTTVSGPPSWGNCSEPTNGIARFSITAPPRTATIAAPICPSSLSSGLRSIASSIAPISAISPPPASTVQVCTIPGRAGLAVRHMRERDRAGQPERRGQHDAGEDRQTSELRRRVAREAALGWVCDRPHSTREPTRERRQQSCDRRRDEKGIDGIQVAHLAA